ncbi:MAG: GNAT family N-acetyltransferase [Pirellulales bacterium]
MFRVVRESRDSVALRELVRLLDADLNDRYGLIQSQYDQFNSLVNIDGVVIAFDGDRAVGCGCFKRYDAGTAEIKRMFVRPENRGSGAAQLVLEELEKWAAAAGYSGTVLETGVKNPEAIRFYTKNGYARIDNYGQYVCRNGK